MTLAPSLVLCIFFVMEVCALRVPSSVVCKIWIGRTVQEHFGRTVTLHLSLLTLGGVHWCATRTKDWAKRDWAKRDVSVEAAREPVPVLIRLWSRSSIIPHASQLNSTIHPRTGDLRSIWTSHYLLFVPIVLDSKKQPWEGPQLSTRL